MDSGTSLRTFSGEDADHREYRRWKQWALNKMRTMDKLSEEARGSFIWTLLHGRALEVVEHLRESDYQVKGGDKVIFDLLDQRWPELDRRNWREHCQCLLLEGQGRGKPPPMVRPGSRALARRVSSSPQKPGDGSC